MTSSHESFPGSSSLFVSLSAAKVGKTSLIMSLVGEEFPEEVRLRGPHLC